jgi:hypothetical protein
MAYFIHHAVYIIIRQIPMIECSIIVFYVFKRILQTRVLAQEVIDPCPISDIVKASSGVYAVDISASDVNDYWIVVLTVIVILKLCRVVVISVGIFFEEVARWELISVYAKPLVVGG